MLSESLWGTPETKPPVSLRQLMARLVVRFFVWLLGNAVNKSPLAFPGMVSTKPPAVDT